MPSERVNQLDIQLEKINAKLAALRLTSISSQLLGPMGELFFVSPQEETLMAEKPKRSRKRKGDEGVSVCLRSKRSKEQNRWWLR